MIGYRKNRPKSVNAAMHRALLRAIAKNVELTDELFETRAARDALMSAIEQQEPKLEQYDRLQEFMKAMQAEGILT